MTNQLREALREIERKLNTIGIIGLHPVIGNVMDLVSSALAAEFETCEWHRMEVGDYATKCGKLIGLVEWRKLVDYAGNLTNCPGCGREIRVTE